MLTPVSTAAKEIVPMIQLRRTSCEARFSQAQERRVAVSLRRLDCCSSSPWPPEGDLLKHLYQYPLALWRHIASKPSRYNPEQFRTTRLMSQALSNRVIVTPVLSPGVETAG
jgi:hypothetical protein